LVFLHEFLLTLGPDIGEVGIREAEEAVIAAAEELDGRMRNASRDAAARLPGLGSSGAPASPGRLGGLAAAGNTNALLALLIDAIRQLAEVTALAVSSFLA